VTGGYTQWLQMRGVAPTLRWNSWLVWLCKGREGVLDLLAYVGGLGVRGYVGFIAYIQAQAKEPPPLLPILAIDHAGIHWSGT
jgi:hypothetical protein